MQKAHKNFKYDVVKLIESVRERPVLWDRTLESYKDRVERRNAWEEIFSILEERYDEMAWEEKHTTGELILNKWTNIRDTFVKSLKLKMGKPKKKYLFHDHLVFLTKIVPEEEYLEEEYPETCTEPVVKQENEESTSYSRKKKKKTASKSSKKSKIEESESDGEYVSNQSFKKIKLTTNSDYAPFEATDTANDDNDIDFVAADLSDVSGRLMNEDEAFFASLLPTVVKYSEDERLEFRIKLLTLMKEIKQKRDWTIDN